MVSNSMNQPPKKSLAALGSCLAALTVITVAAGLYLEYSNDRLVYEVAKKDCVNGIASVTTAGPGQGFVCK